MKARYGMFPQGLYNINHMPIPENISVALMSDIEFMRRGTTELIWCLWPRRCYASNRWLCITLAYRIRNVWTGPGTPAIEDRWYSREECLILKLKGN